GCPYDRVRRRPLVTRPVTTLGESKAPHDGRPAQVHAKPVSAVSAPRPVPCAGAFVMGRSSLGRRIFGPHTTHWLEGVPWRVRTSPRRSPSSRRVSAAPTALC